MATKDRSREEWAAIMARYEERRSDTTVQEFAAEEGVSYHAVVYRLYKESKREKKKAVSRAHAEAVRLVPVQVGGHSSAEPWPSTWLEAETPSGMRVRFLEGTGCEYVAELMSRIVARGA
jgi:hypothetical protein